MKKYNDEMTKYKGLYMGPYTLLKAYVFGIIMALLITLPAYLIILNIIYLSHYFKIVLGIMVLVSLLLVYLILYFKDRYLLINIEDAKNIKLLYIRLIDMLIISISVLILYILYVIIF